MRSIRIILNSGLIVAVWVMSSLAALLGLQFESPQIEGFHPLDKEIFESSPLNSPKPVILKLNAQMFKDTSVIDFEKRQITFRRNDLLGFTMWEYHFSELSDYLATRRNFVLYRGWYRDALAAKRVIDKKEQQQSLKMQWELPVQYPSWAQRVLGNEPPRLNVDGHITINMGFDRSTLKEAEDTDDEKDSHNNFGFDMNYEFGISGTVGKLINVSIRVKDDEFVQDNNFKNFKIEYKESTPGEMEDEIIQEVIAGWTSFEMPGTQLSGYSGGKDGLFGIKIKSKFGPLTLTTIASQEKGEASKMSAGTKKGGIPRPLEVDKYIKNRFFFLDNLYRSYYNRNNSIKSGVNKILPPRIDTLYVFMRLSDQDNRVGKISAKVDSTDQAYSFIQLIPGTGKHHYEVDKDNGWIRFDTSIRENDHIAVYMRTSDPSLNRGELVAANSYRGLWTIKPSSPILSESEDPSRFFLMWRNVYELDSANFSSFELTVTRKKENEPKSTDRIGENGMLISAVLGLTDVSGKPFSSSTAIYDREHGVMIIPPYDTCANCNEPFNNPELGEEYRDPEIYRKHNPDVNENYKPFYKIETTGNKRETQVNLGWQVEPGSELVKTFSGEVLERDRDYVIDYESGIVELVSPRALAAEGVNVDYQQEALFVPESKAFLGVRGEVALPFLSDKSIIGASMLFQNARTNDIPRLKQEPYSKLLFDINALVDLEPEWMTELIDRIPLVQTDVTSSAVFEFEAAHSRTNPNTNELAYLDDFEDSKKAYPLATAHESWYKASPPSIVLSRSSATKKDTLRYYDSIFYFPPAWDFYWFYPRAEDKSYRDSVWVRNTVKATANDDRFDPVLRLHCKPSPDSDSLTSRFKNAWAGIMYSVSQNSFTRNEYKYFEFVVNPNNSRGKKLIFQMGVMNEDISIDGGPPNKKPDREDTTKTGTASSKMDLGLDKKNDDEEFYLIPKAVYNDWDTLRKGNPLFENYYINDPAKDNARGPNNKEYEDDPNNRRNACKLQGDGKFSSEDIDFNGTVETSIKENYFQFVIDLDDTSSIFIDHTAKVHKQNGWRKYRIPIQENLDIKDSINKPSWSKVSTVRLIWTDFDSLALKTEQQLLITDMQFTGNYWQAQRGSDTTAAAEAFALSSQEDRYYADNSADSRINRKKISGTNDYEQEQSLKINFSGVKSGDVALVRKTLNYQNMDISQYKKLTILHFGDTSSGNYPDPDGVLYNGDLNFVFRFGNGDSTYYEYRDVIKSGWQQAVIDLAELTKLKDRFVVKNPGMAINDSSGNYKVVAKKVGTEPSIANITWMALGVECRSVNTTNEYSGSVWVNEMKVDEISRLNGWAARASMNTKWADFLDIKAGVNYNDGDFRMMNESGYSARDSKLQANISSNVNLDRFLPRNWGVSVPLGGSLSSNIDRPQLKKNTDTRLENDGIFEMVTDAVETISGNSSTDPDISSESEQYGSKGFSGNVYTTYGKSAKSDNPLVNLTADRISTNVSYSRSINTENLGPSPQKDSIYIIENKSDDYVGKLYYDLSPNSSPVWATWRPFDKMESAWASTIKKYELSLLPSTIKFDIADINYSEANRLETKNKIDSRTYRYDLRHGFKFSYSPIAPLLTLNYNVNVTRDLDSIATSNSDNKWKNAGVAIKRNKEWENYYLLLGETGRSQELSLSIKPEIVSWFTTDFDYSSTYSSSMVTLRNDPALYINGSVLPRFSFNSSLQISTMLNKLAEITAKSAVGKIFAKADTLYGKIGLRSVNFTYSAETNLKNNYLGTTYLSDVGFADFFMYQSGFSGRRDLLDYIKGSMDESELGGIKSRQKTDSLSRYGYDTKSIARKYNISTGLDLKFPFEISFSPISLEWSENASFKASDTLSYDSSLTFPKLQVSANTSVLMKLDLIKNHFRSFRCNSSYNYEMTKSWSKTPTYNESRKSAWRPLFSANTDLSVAPVSINYSFNFSNTNDFLGDNHEMITSSKTDNTNEHEFSINYEIQKNSKLSEIKIYNWTIPVSGKTTVGIKGSYKTQKEEKSVKDAEPEITINTLSYSISPRITYIFTNNIDGEMYYQGGQDRDRKENENNSVRTTNKFAIILNVKL